MSDLHEDAKQFKEIEMSATYIILKGATKEEATQKANAAIKTIDFMRQPHIEQTNQKPDGTWEIVIKQWGLD